MSQRRHRIAGRLALASALVIATACSSDARRSSDGGASAPRRIIASFYPLQFAAQRVGGDRVEVANLTPSGTEPHDLELTAQDTAALADADLVVYLGGFAAAVDEGVDEVAADHSLDVAPAANLIEDDDGRDPHFWLDPTRLAAVADAIAARLSETDPEGADDYRANAKAFGTELVALDAQFDAGLGRCASTAIVTSHEAFGYLAARYGFEQIGVTGLSPEDELAPADLADVADYARTHDVHTIYTESLVDPAVARTVASETGATTAVLDPLEGLADADVEAGADYFSVMRANLTTLRAGQGCT